VLYPTEGAAQDIAVHADKLCPYCLLC